SSPIATSPLPILSISHSPSNSAPRESASQITQPKRRPKLDQTPPESGGSERLGRSIEHLNTDEEGSYTAQRRQFNMTFSPTKQGYHSDQPISPIAARTQLPESSEEYIDSPIQPSDLSQLVFHLNKVNEWVKNHQIDGLSMDDLLPSTSSTSQSTPRKNPHFPALSSSSHTPQRHHQRFSSMGETSSARSNRSMSSSMGPPPTPLKLFGSPSKQSTYSSPSKPSSVKTFQGSTSMRTQLLLQHTAYLSTDDEVSSTQDEDEDSNVFLTNSRDPSPIKLREDIDQWRTGYQRPSLLGTISSEPT
ncbi:11424_t:CDS:2, partial [Acaulospora colombiana]